jgi:hypothetical protein
MLSRNRANIDSLRDIWRLGARVEAPAEWNLVDLIRSDRARCRYEDRHEIAAYLDNDAKAPADYAGQKVGPHLDNVAGLEAQRVIRVHDC